VEHLLEEAVELMEVAICAPSRDVAVRCFVCLAMCGCAYVCECVCVSVWLSVCE
jgi:hypothetical protein